MSTTQRNHALPARPAFPLVDGITHRAMMGEYIIYIHGKIAAYVCDNRLFVKPVDAARRLLPNAALTPPFEGARGMLPRRGHKRLRAAARAARGHVPRTSRACQKEEKAPAAAPFLTGRLHERMLCMKICRSER